jgi:hypothetical protein
MAKPIVDLKRSDWDKRKSDPSKGQYVFNKKIYYKNKDFQEGYVHPYKIKWCKYSEYDYPRPFSSYHKWQKVFKATPLTIGDDYWPEDFVPDAEGKYVDMDLVCVKIPIEVHVEHRKRQKEKSELQSMSVKKEFTDKTKEAGIDIPEDVIEEEMERIKKESRALGL